MLDRARRELLRHGEPVPLTPKAFDILLVLVAHAGQVVPKEVLLRDVWPDTVVEESNLTFQISMLRKALAGGARNGDRTIVTIPGRGYQLAAPVERMATELVVEERTTTVARIEEEERPSRRPVVLLALILAAVLAAVLVVGFGLDLRTLLPRKESAPSVRTLAVLPFKPLVAAERDEALEMGMADTLIAKISSIHGVTVPPLSSVRRFGGLEQDPIEAGRRLGVDAVLDGSIHNAGGQVRVTVRLLRVADAAQLWSAHFDNAFANIFALNDAISSSLVRELSFQLTDEERTRLRRRETQNPEAYRAYLLGRLYASQPRRDNLLRAIASYQNAVALDPRYALPYLGIADASIKLPISSDYRSGPPSEAAKAAAIKALSIDPGLSAAHGVLGREKFWYEWDWKGSEAEFRAGLSLDPSSAELHLGLAHLLANIGRHAESLQEAEEVRRLDPLSLMGATLRGAFLHHAGQLDDAILAQKRVLELTPDFWIAHLSLGNAYREKGMNEEALAHYRLSWKQSGGSVEPLAREALVLGKTGRVREGREILAKMMAMNRERYVPPYNFAIVYTGLGEKAEAVRWMRKACAERDARLVFLKVEPLWNELRGQPGFDDVERCVGLP